MSLTERCDALGQGPRALPELIAFLRSLDLPDVERAQVEQADLSRPYGRYVFLDTPTVEGMVATWTPLTWCAPHDHGGSVGGVRVLRGSAEHRVFRVRDGVLELVKEESIGPGQVISCGPDLVHAMRDAGGDEALMTLHLYADPIDHMVVYDDGCTYVVDGGCGAWIPSDQPELIRSRHAGILRRPA